jgi:6-phosphogluconolactonase
MSVDVRVVDDPARAVAELLADVSGEVALSGGATVGRAYELAASLRSDWSGVRAWYGDDRAVPPDHPDSNHRLVNEMLLSRVAVRPEVRRIEGELGAVEAARRYDAELDGVTLEFALNGIGPDGHTASLFPNSPALEERARRVVAAEAGLEPFVPRVTMTPPVFASSRLLVYLVAGAEKRDAVRHAFAEPPSPSTPASLIRGVDTIAFVDPPAAALLEGL